MSTPRDNMPPGRNLALELVPPIEAAALQKCDHSELDGLRRCECRGGWYASSGRGADNLDA